MSKDRFYRSGDAGASPIGSGVGADRRIDDLILAMNKMSKRISALEDVRDAGEPVNQHFVDCLEKNARELTKANAYWEDLCQRLQMENADLKYRSSHFEIVECQTARKCLGIVSKIKNEPLTTMSPSREWMVAICEDIERVIKQEFGIK